MPYSTHLLRTEKKRLYRKLFFGFSSVIIAFLLVLFIGLPLLAKFILFLTPNTQDTASISQNQSQYLFPPVLDHLFEATNSAKIILTGTGDKDSKVKIIVNNKTKITVSTDKDGKFKTANISLSEGENTITAVTLKDDKESSPSNSIVVTYNNELPTLDITSPADNQKFSGEDKEINIIGETDPGNRVTINDRTVIVATNGKFTYRASLSDGDNLFEIQAYNQAGNIFKVEKKVRYLP